MSLVPFEVLTELKCSKCTKYLSCLPIMMNKKDILPICGRCSQEFITNDEWIEIKPFESLLKCFKFPCIYDKEGCIEKLTVVETPNHEANCPYRIVSCALDCVWQGTVRDLTDHVEELHSNEVLRNGEFEMGLLDSYEKFNFLCFEDELFGFRQIFKQSENKIECSVFCYKTVDLESKYFYEISVTNGPRSISTKFPLKSVNSAEDNEIEIDIDNIKKILNDPSIMIGTVKILFAKSAEPETSSREFNSEVLSELLAEFECPVCYHYIIPPIYQCDNGHTICEECKSSVAQCPSCRGVISDKNNITLGKLSSLLTYPCRFSVYGCNFSAKPQVVKQHQVFCQHGPQVCPFKDSFNCKWENSAKEIYAHITSTHHENILDVDNVCIFLGNDYFQNEDSAFYIKKLSNMLFKLHYKYSNNRFYWAVQLIGLPEEAKNYKFEIDIVDTSNSTRKIFLRSYCSALKPDDQSFDDANEYVFLSLEQVQPLITEELRYFIRITK